MKILHVHHALYLPVVYVRELRKRGYEAYSLYFCNPDYKWITGTPDYNLGPYSRLLKNWPKYVDFIFNEINKFDIIHFHSESCFIPYSSRLYKYHILLGMLDLRYLHSLSKKIIYSHWGCMNGRLQSNFAKENGGKICNNCRSGVIGKFCSDETTHNICIPQEKYGHSILNHEPDFGDYNRKAQYHPAIVDFENFSLGGDIPEGFQIRKSPDYFYIYHAVGGSKNRANERGTMVIRKTIHEMRNEGYKIQLISTNGTVPYNFIKYLQKQADLAIDHLYYGWYGNMVRECMAQAIPVATYLNPAWLKQHMEIYEKTPPIINVNDQNLRQTLTYYLHNREELQRLGKEQRSYILDVHSTNKVIDRLIKVYEG